jgi:hypothetical protein
MVAAPFYRRRSVSGLEGPYSPDATAKIRQVPYFMLPAYLVAFGQQQHMRLHSSKPLLEWRFWQLGWLLPEPQPQYYADGNPRRTA